MSHDNKENFTCTWEINVASANYSSITLEPNDRKNMGIFGGGIIDKRKQYIFSRKSN